MCWICLSKFVAQTKHGALGAAMFAATAAGIYTKVEDAQKARNSGFANEYRPNAENAAAYKEIYEKYIKLGQFTEKELFK